MTTQSFSPVMSADEVNRFLKQVYPQLNDAMSGYSVVDVSPGACVVRLEATHDHVRPGGTVSGPALFSLADIGGYTCILSHAGPEALCVTTNLNINFMRKAEPGPIDGYCRILKLGKSLMVFDVEMRTYEHNHVVAHATGTYSIPPRR